MNKSELLKFYNIHKILKAKDLAKLSKTYKDNSEVLIVMFKQKPNKPNNPPKWFTTYMDKFEKKIEQKIDQKIDKAINNPDNPPKWFTTYMNDFRLEISQMVDKKLDSFAKLNNLRTR